MKHLTTVLSRVLKSRIFGFVPGWLALILVLGGMAAAAPPVFNGQLVTGAPQTSVGQVFQVTNAYPGLTIADDLGRVEIGGFPTTDEFYGGGTTFGTQAFVSAIRTPGGTTGNCGTAPCQDAAFAGYAQTDNAGRYAVGLYGEAGVMVASAYGAGLNTEVVNCENHNTACTTSGGFDFSQLEGSENDVVIYDKSGPTAPTGSVYGTLNILNAPQDEPAGTAVIGYDLSSAHVGTSGWKDGFSCEQGSVVSPYYCFNVGIVAAGNSQNSQDIAWNATNSSGAVITNTMNQLSNGDWCFTQTVDSVTDCFTHAYPNYKMSGALSAANLGLQINNTGTGAGTQSILSLQTGTANSNAQFILQDNSQLVTQVGAAIGQWNIQVPVVVSGKLTTTTHNACSASSNVPCETTAQCSISAGTSCSVNATVPTSSVCVASANATDNTTSWEKITFGALSTNTLPVNFTVGASQTSTAAANLVCL